MMRCPFTIHLSVYSEEINEQEVALKIKKVLAEHFGPDSPVLVDIGEKWNLSEHAIKIRKAKRKPFPMHTINLMN